MSRYSGQISKLITKIGKPISYQLPIGDKVVDLNSILGNNIQFSFDGEIRCIECNVKIKKTFMQGYCYPCFISSPKTSECILKPELCKAHLGEARNMQWAEEHCLQDQYIYLALTSNLKVGVTRHTQIPTRWIDQGAHRALTFAKTPNRYLAGMIEKELSKTISDRTYWRRMLLGEYPKLDLIQEKIKLSKTLSSEYEQFITQDNQEIILDYPVTRAPQKIKSLNFDKTATISGTLNGIKGQYLFLDDEYVLNIRKFTGYFLKFSSS